MVIRQKQRTDHWLERSVEESTGLWSRVINYRSELIPEPKTLQTLGKFLTEDKIRFETWETAANFVRGNRESGIGNGEEGRGKKKSVARIFQEFEERLREENKLWPRWFQVWRFYAPWLSADVDLERPKMMRLGFGNAQTGFDCSWADHRKGRVMILDMNGVKHIAVMMKEGWHWWHLFENGDRTGECYKWLVFNPTGYEWKTVKAEFINEAVERNELCLFRLEHSPVFDAVVGEKNEQEKWARIARAFTLWLSADETASGKPRFVFDWSVMYNPAMAKTDQPEKYKPRILERMQEMKYPWAERVRDWGMGNGDSGVEEAARWVVENDGCIVLPEDATPEDVLKVATGLFYVTFPDRPVDAVGGLLRGYQMLGRMVMRTQKGLYCNNTAIAQKKIAGRRKQMTDERRAYVVRTLQDRAKRVLAERNGLTEDEAGRLLDSAGCAETLTKAAQELGLFEKQKLTLFTTGETTLPDLSLAVAFEKKLNLESKCWKPKRLVQTTRIRPVEECRNYRRETFTRTYPIEPITAKRKLRSKRGGWTDDRRWIAKDDTGWYLIAVKRDDNSFYRKAKFAGEGIELKAMRFVSDSLRARTNMRIETTSFEYNALMKLAVAGHIGVWRVDVKNDGQFWNDLWSERNAAPCAVVAKLGIGDSGLGNREWVLVVDYTVGARFKRDGRKTEGREINAYLDAWPEDAGKPRCYEFREAIKKDGILVAQRQRMPELIELAKYVVVDDGLKGYQIWDRVFWDDGSGERKHKRPELTTFAQKYGANKDMLAEFERQILSDKIFAKCGGDLNADALRHTQSFDRIGAATTLPSVATPQLDSVEGSSRPSDADKAFFDCGVATEGSVVATSENASLCVSRSDLRSIIEREFGRIVITGTMAWRRQMTRPAHEVALGVWLAGFLV